MFCMFDLRPTVLLFHSSECKSTLQGTEYAGYLSQTKTGLTCQKWSSQLPHQHDNFTTFPDGGQASAWNYCRNPDSSTEGPWCYTTDPGVIREYCDVKFC